MATRGRGDARYCPAAGCPRVVRAGHLMCPVHWSGVPKDLQRTVWTRWRAWSAQMTDEAWAAYKEARADALRSVGIEP